MWGVIRLESLRLNPQDFYMALASCRHLSMHWWRGHVPALRQHTIFNLCRLRSVFTLMALCSTTCNFIYWGATYSMSSTAVHKLNTASLKPKSPKPRHTMSCMPRAIKHLIVSTRAIMHKVCVYVCMDDVCTYVCMCVGRSVRLSVCLFVCVGSYQLVGLAGLNLLHD